MFKMHSGKLDKDLTYCKGVIKPNFTYTYVIINHTWSIAIGTDLILLYPDQTFTELKGQGL